MAGGGGRRHLLFQVERRTGVGNDQKKAALVGNTGEAN